MALLKAKKPKPRLENDKVRKELMKEDQMPLYGRVDESLYWKLKDKLQKERMGYAEWLRGSIMDYVYYDSLKSR